MAASSSGAVTVSTLPSMAMVWAVGPGVWVSFMQILLEG